MHRKLRVRNRLPVWLRVTQILVLRVDRAAQWEDNDDTFSWVMYKGFFSRASQSEAYMAMKNRWVPMSPIQDPCPFGMSFSEPATQTGVQVGSWPG